MSELVLSVAEAARALGVSDDVIYRWLDTGVLPELPRVSRRRLIPRAAVERLVAECMADWDPATARQDMEVGA